MKCSKCGYNTGNDLVFCPRCGNKMEDIESNFLQNDEFKRCPKCGKEYIVSMDHCFQCGYKIESYIKRMNDLKNTIDIKEHSIKHIPHCPTCNSTNIRKIGAGERAASIIGLGLFSRKINKTWKCNDCGHTW